VCVCVFLFVCLFFKAPFALQLLLLSWSFIFSFLVCDSESSHPFDVWCSLLSPHFLGLLQKCLVHGFMSFGSLVVFIVHDLDFFAGNCLLGFCLFCISIDIEGERFGFLLLSD
jgi:hypothetical protein